MENELTLTKGQTMSDRFVLNSQPASSDVLTALSQLDKQLIAIDNLNQHLYRLFFPLTKDFEPSVEIQLAKNSIANLLYDVTIYGDKLIDKVKPYRERINSLIHDSVFERLHIDISVNVFDNQDIEEDLFFNAEDSWFDEDNLQFYSGCDPNVVEVVYSCYLPLSNLSQVNAKVYTFSHYPTQEEWMFAKAIVRFLNKRFGISLTVAKPVELNEKDLQTIRNVLADKNCKAQLEKLTAPAFNVDKTIYLNIAKRGVSLEFLFDGYNFCWNSCGGEPFKKYSLPINYSLYDRSWRFNEIEPSGYCKRELKETDYNSYDNFRSYFAPALDNNYIYGYFEPAIVLNKGRVFKIQKKADNLYFLNDKNDVIVTVNNDQVANPRLLLQLINDLLIKLGK